MDWSDVRVFLAVARAGTLGAAARTLKISHPTAGRRLRALEEATGQVLFQRTAEGYILTDEGRSVFALAEQMEENALALERRLAGGRQEPEGIVRLSCADWFGGYVLPPVLKEFSEKYPAVEVEMLISARLYNLARREADLAFRIVPFNNRDIVQRRLLDMPYGVYIARNLPDPTVGDGEGQRLLTMDASTGSYPDTMWLQDRFPRAGIGLRSNNRHIQARMCASGLGIAVLPRPLGDQVPNLRQLGGMDEPPTRSIWMGYHRDLRDLGRLRAFVDLVVKHIAT
ncbi:MULTISPECIES: LysR family transcriptional regulator [unclassified Thalassospira]|uniref:LysR family transcriptional regulator n=1 Tax=unclassified Thalassospira TaxID=2648997 RepID=UPI000A1FEF9C|nr:LysR family transcriptional regulator [Thalassospira sp. MCCC 1A01428]OSQ46425.1 LysR family transcriptional regulator [Thalassospira sp. MCCC 1A01428]